MTKFVKFGSVEKSFNPDLKPVHVEKVKKVKISPRSKKRTDENKVYLTLRDVFLKDKICPITGQAATEVHHTFCGKDRDRYFLDIKTWLAVSRDGHNYIHDNPKEAREKWWMR